MAKSNLQRLQISIAVLLLFTVLLRNLFSITAKPAFISLCFIWCMILSLHYYFHHRSNPVYLLDYSCFKPPSSRKCSYQVSESFVRGCPNFSPQSISFMRGIYLKSGLGDETYAPQFFFENEKSLSSLPNLKSSIDEAREGMFSAIDSLALKTGIELRDHIDTVIVTCGSFAPSPSLASLIVNRYNLNHDVKTFNLSGMGCSSGVLSMDLAARLIRRKIGVSYVLIAVTESISSNWYFGQNRSMLVTNCIFRVGSAAAILTNDTSRRRFAKMELVDSLRTHHGTDASYRAAFQEEDENGFTGVSLTKDLIRVAGMNLRSHITQLAPRVLPLSQLASYGYSVAVSLLSRGVQSKPIVPDFTTAFDHVCIHTGGKAVIEEVASVLKLGDEITEPARMSLHRFGNTSSSLVFYELAYFEAKNRVKKGDKMWMLAFGTGFKVGSLVWKSLRNSVQEKCDSDNPWTDCIDSYPVKAW